jgi:hypothetical protein
MQEYHGQQQQQGIRDLDVPELFWVFPEHVIENEGVDIINEQEDEGCYAECTQGVTALTKKDNTREQEQDGGVYQDDGYSSEGFHTPNKTPNPLKNHRWSKEQYFMLV